MPAWIHNRAQLKNPEMLQDARTGVPHDPQQRSEKVAFYDELAKLGAISDEYAQQALDQLDRLDRTKPTPGQVGRYALIGAAAAPVVKAVGNVVKGRAPFDFGAANAARGLAGELATGALGAGMVPLLRHHSDRIAATGTLKNYLAERAKEEAPAPGPMLIGQPKLGFQVSQYSGPLSMGAFKQTSGMPAFKVPSLAAPVEKKAAPTTPAGLLSASRGVGFPKVTSPGGSIAAIAKPKGFGKPLAGAKNPNSLL